MILHVLPGDAYANNFRETGLEGEVAICRESLIEGDLEAENLDEFWKIRERFLTGAHPDSESHYLSDVAAELEKLIDLPENTEVNLWFEHELFCQVNMWFCVSLLRNPKAKVYRVGPVLKNGDDIWKGFGELNADELKICFSSRKLFSPADIALGSNLWDAYRTGNHPKLKLLAEHESPCFPYLREVCEAAIEKETHPQQILKEIIDTGITEFSDIFAEFSHRARVYGFGDAQVKRML